MANSEIQHQYPIRDHLAGDTLYLNVPDECRGLRMTEILQRGLIALGVIDGARHENIIAQFVHEREEAESRFEAEFARLLAMQADCQYFNLEGEKVVSLKQVSEYLEAMVVGRFAESPHPSYVLVENALVPPADSTESG